MYLHIGNGENVRTEDIVGIFDLDSATVSGHTKKYISKSERAGRVEYTDSDLPRSFIVISKNKKEKVKLSRISTYGLKMRIDGEIDSYNESEI
jgi:hypothetical protein